MKATRDEVYAAIDTERAYQDDRWNSETTTSGGFHSLEDWYTYITDYVREAQHILSRETRQVSDPKALDIMRKVAAMGVSAMEQHGAPHRQRVLKLAAPVDKHRDTVLLCGCRPPRCAGHEARPYHRVVGRDADLGRYED